MFILDEIEKILEKLAVRGRKKYDSDQLLIALPDVERIDIERLKLSTKVQFELKETNLKDSLKQVDQLQPDRLKQLHGHLSTDSLLNSLSDGFLFSRIAQVPMPHYPSAKLVICDRVSHEILMKLKRISHLTNSRESNSFIYRSPYNVTAIFLLSDVMNLFEQQGKPLLYIKRDTLTRELLANYNYAVIRKTFPYLRITDLIFLVCDKSKINLKNFVINSSREHHLIHSLSHFAHSTLLLEIDPILRIMGKTHQIYNNVLVFQQEGDKAQNIFSRLTLPHISMMAERLIDVAERLHLDLRSISYRVGDPYGQTRVFTQMLSTGKASKQLVKQEDGSGARVLVLDRSFDLLSPMLHADKYGPFLEQEKLIRIFGQDINKLRADNVDELDEKLQLNGLTEVLSTILKYAMSLKSVEFESPKKIEPQLKKSLSSSLSNSQSIRRHLDIVKLVYKCLNEGYLLLIRLEASLESMSNELRSLKEPSNMGQQDQFADKLQRMNAAFKQLIKIAGKSIRACDIVRLAIILLDVVNLFSFIHNHKTKLSDKVNKIVQEVKTYLSRDKEFVQAIKSRLELNEETESCDTLLERIAKYEKSSRELCGQKSILPLEIIIEKFYQNELDQDSFPVVSLSDKQIDTKIIIIVLLCTITPHELAKVKALELTLHKTRKLKQIYIITGGIQTPGEILKAIDS